MSDADRALEADLARYYDQESGDRAERDLEPRRVEQRARFLDRLGGESKRRVLEVGTGPGRDAAALVEAGCDAWGADLAAASARRCRALGVEAVVASVLHLPFATGSFDAVWSMSTLLHVPDRTIESALGEVRRVLVPGGLAAIGVWGGSDHEGVSDADRYDPPRFFSRRSDERWRAFLLGALGDLEEFVTWSVGDDPGFWYQFAVVRTK